MNIFHPGSLRPFLLFAFNIKETHASNQASDCFGRNSGQEFSHAQYLQTSTSTKGAKIVLEIKAAENKRSNEREVYD